MTRNAVVMGARGRLGWAVTQALARQGWRVVAQVRPGAPVPAAPEGVTWRPAGVDETDALAQMPGGVHCVVHALNPAYTRQAWRTEAQGLLDASLALARRSGATLLFPGNVYNFGADMPAVLTEDTPQRPTTALGRARVSLEQRLQVEASQGVRSVVLRAGNFFGGGTGTWLDRVMAKDLHRGRFTYPGPLDVPVAWAYLPDLATAVADLASLCVASAPPQPVGSHEVLHFRGHDLRGQNWLCALQGIANSSMPSGDKSHLYVKRDSELAVRGMPWSVMRLLGWVQPELQAVCDMRYLWQRPHTLSNERLRQRLGAEPHTDWPMALAAAWRELAPGAQPEAPAAVRAPAPRTA